MSSTKSVTAAHGWSARADADGALDEIFAGHDLAEASLGIVFASSDYDLHSLGQAVADRFPCPVIGCSTAGEVCRAGYKDSGVVAAALFGVDVSVEPIRDIKSFDTNTASDLTRKLGTQELSYSEHAVLLTLFDGLCMREETLTSQIYLASGGVPLVGSSSGDNLTFDNTSVLIDGQFEKGAGLCALIRAPGGLQTFIDHHYEDTGSLLVVTKADPERRTIIELNGIPAADAYVRALGVDRGHLSKVDELLNPLMVNTGERFYVRSVRQLHDDGSIQLFCAIDEGVVLHLGKPGLAHKKLQDQLERTCTGMDPQLVLMFDCITRRLEADHAGTKDDFARVTSRYPCIGFSTYGEQYNGVHVNQTVTGVVFGG